MTVFTVHEPPTPPVDRIDRAEAMIFLKDGFTWSAFLLGPVWLLANRLWLATAGYVAVAAFGYLLLEAAGAAEALFGPFLLALNAVLGFEAHWMKSAKLEAAGWHTLGSVSGQNLTDCERRFFEGWLPSQPLLRRAPADAPPAPPPGPAAPHAKTAGGEPRPITNAPPDPASRTRRHPFALFRRSREA